LRKHAKAKERQKARYLPWRYHLIHKISKN
jgi:hypothetical protein